MTKRITGKTSDVWPSTRGRFTSIRFEAEKDDSTALLAGAFRNKTVIPRVEIREFTSKYEDGFVAYNSFELVDVIVTSYSVVNDIEGVVCLTRLSYQKIRLTNHDRDASGRLKTTVRYTWNARDGEAYPGFMPTK